MAWLRIDDRVRTHPKVVQAGMTAAWFWFCGICYCREHLTDGFIAKAMLPTLSAGAGTKAAALAAKLVKVGLWHEVEGGYQVHDFLDWNPARAEVLRKRKEDADRKRRGHQNGAGSVTDSIGDSAADSTRNPDSVQVTPHARAGARARAISGSSGSSDQQDRFSRTTLHRPPHPDLMTLGGVELWASQFGQIVTMATPQFGGDREQADRAVRAWVADIDDAFLRDGAPAEAVKQPRKFWQDAAADRYGRKGVASGPRPCRNNHKPPCASDAECTRRYLAGMAAPTEAGR
jgi:hypothetical protein